MKRILALAVVAAALSVPTAQAATPTGPTMAQFNALKTQLAKDEKKLKILQNEVNIAFSLFLCENAINADAFQGTWQSVDTLAVSLGKPAVFGAQTMTVNDDNACSDFRITRSHAIPPNVSVFSALATFITG